MHLLRRTVGQVGASDDAGTEQLFTVVETAGGVLSPAPGLPWSAPQAGADYELHGGACVARSNTNSRGCDAV